MKSLLQKGGKLNMAEIPLIGSSQRNYKDTLFRKIFSDKEKLLSLYNAVNNTVYDNPSDLRINTLENAIYLNMKNDISFIFDFHLNLYEHQSTYSPSMPLRNLFYIARLLEAEIGTETLYASVAPELPFPSFIVFYNGTNEHPEQKVLKLSDLYKIHPTSPKLELLVMMLNVNYGKNQILMDHCQALKEYAIYVEKVRKYITHMEINKAVELAVTESIKEGILEEFMTKYRAEAIQVSILEYNQEREMEKVRRAERREGHAEGRIEGLDEGCNKTYIKLIRNMHQTGKSITDIILALNLEEPFVKSVIKILNQSPNLSDTEITKEILSNKAIKSVSFS